MFAHRKTGSRCRSFWDDFGSPLVHLLSILENERDSEMFGQVGALLATGTIPSEVLEGFGADDSSSEARWGVRGITVGDIIRRLVARTIAKQIARQAEEATAPHQYALNTKAGCECVTDLDPEATIVCLH